MLFVFVDNQKLIYESYFTFGIIWAFGGCLSDEKGVNQRELFSTWLKSTTKLKLPEAGNCFDYKFEAHSLSWVHWKDYISAWEPLVPVNTMSFSDIAIPSVENVR